MKSFMVLIVTILIAITFTIVEKAETADVEKEVAADKNDPVSFLICVDETSLEKCKPSNEEMQSKGYGAGMAGAKVYHSGVESCLCSVIKSCWEKSFLPNFPVECSNLKLYDSK